MDSLGLLFWLFSDLQTLKYGVCILSLRLGFDNKSNLAKDCEFSYVNTHIVSRDSSIKPDHTFSLHLSALSANTQVY